MTHIRWDFIRKKSLGKMDAITHMTQILTHVFIHLLRDALVYSEGDGLTDSLECWTLFLKQDSSCTSFFHSWAELTRCLYVSGFVLGPWEASMFLPLGRLGF